MKISDFDYHLPSEYIAQTPIEPRDRSRLMVVDRNSGSIRHTIFNEIGDHLHPGDLLVLNETRVIPARLYAAKLPGGGRVELLLLHKEDEQSWEVLVGGKGLKVGRQLEVDEGPLAEVIAMLDGPRRVVRFQEPIEPYLSAAGHVPLPPYIKTLLKDPERYQTIYARQPGSAAAPTAGLHFTQPLIDHLVAQGIRFTSLTLHVGLDTFAPVTEDDPRLHAIHTEYCHLTTETAQVINNTRRNGGRIIAVGTTSMRTLESAAHLAGEGDVVGALEGPTDLFILPGYEFQVVDALITNFHLPRSSLIMMVSAFCGRETILGAYEIAMEQQYRFYSFGDAMLIV
ncbi:MAG: tRNA preQ1(34) S-adenosylmethionine ribosyltransferase-isomerase QueA [Chloroflexi bacterium]|nr:tRNA preQ1(34) S-adenosylmethionine ribosyltransferase-isomerase QueA [Chloroflexota bacterium]